MSASGGNVYLVLLILIRSSIVSYGENIPLVLRIYVSSSRSRRTANGETKQLRFPASVVSKGMGREGGRDVGKPLLTKARRRYSRGTTIVIRTCDQDQNLYIPVFLLTTFGPDYYVPDIHGGPP